MEFQGTYHLLIAVIIIVVPLFIVFIFSVQFGLLKKEKAKFQLQQNIKENGDLLGVCKKCFYHIT